MMIVAFQLCRI